MDNSAWLWPPPEEQIRKGSEGSLQCSAVDIFSKVLKLPVDILSRGISKIRINENKEGKKRQKQKGELCGKIFLYEVKATACTHVFF